MSTILSGALTSRPTRNGPTSGVEATSVLGALSDVALSAGSDNSGLAGGAAERDRAAPFGSDTAFEPLTGGAASPNAPWGPLAGIGVSETSPIAFPESGRGLADAGLGFCVERDTATTTTITPTIAQTAVKTHGARQATGTGSLAMRARTRA